MRCTSCCSMQFQSYVRKSIYRHWSTAIVQSLQSSPSRHPYKRIPTPIQGLYDKSIHCRSYSTEPTKSTAAQQSRQPTYETRAQRDQSSNPGESLGRDRKQQKHKDGPSYAKKVIQPNRSRNTKDLRNLKERAPVRQRETWQIQKAALEEKFGNEPWSPRKRISPDALEGIRSLHSKFPEKFTTPVLAEQFKISPEAVRRILRSKWRPSEEEEKDRRARWDNRGQKIWTGMSELGLRPPKKWREMGIGKRGGRRERRPSGRIQTTTPAGSTSHQGQDEVTWSSVEQSPWTQDESRVIAQETIGERIL